MNDAFVLDCSATLPWIFESETSAGTDRLLDELTQGAKAWVPALWHLEVANVLLGAKRKGRIDQAGIEQFFARLGAYDIEVDSETMPVAWSKTFGLAAMYELTVYDAAYLELGLRKGVPLASLDEDLRAAFRQAGGSLAI